MFKIKPFVTITLFIFWAITVAILTAGLVFYQANKGDGKPVGTESVTNIVLSVQEIAKHGSTSDCWIIFSDRVYDVTSAISAHPGGSDAIIQYCGKDGTQAFKTKNKPEAKDHSAQAYSWLESLYIGDVGQAVEPAVIQKVKDTAAKTAPQRNSELEDD